MADLLTLPESEKLFVADSICTTLNGFCSLNSSPSKKKKKRKPKGKVTPQSKTEQTLSAEKLETFQPFKELDRQYCRLLRNHKAKRAESLKDSNPSVYQELCALGDRRNQAYQAWKEEKKANGLIKEQTPSDGDSIKV